VTGKISFRHVQPDSYTQKKFRTKLFYSAEKNESVLGFHISQILRSSNLKQI